MGLVSLVQMARREDHAQTGHSCEHGIWRCKVMGQDRTGGAGLAGVDMQAYSHEHSFDPLPFPLPCQICFPHKTSK